MAIYLGSEKIIFTEGSKVEVESPYTRQIIEGTISGIYSNSRINTVGAYAFASCSNLISANFPNCVSIGSSAFYSCFNLTSVNFPNCSDVGSGAFRECYNLTTTNFPKCSYVRNYAFAYCSNLISVSFPNCASIGNSAFSNCSNLITVNMLNCSYIGTYVFNRCYNLLSVYLLGSSMVSLGSTDAFTLTPISDYTTSTGGVYGSIYVPSSLYNNYLTATNWSVYSARIVSV